MSEEFSNEFRLRESEDHSKEKPREKEEKDEGKLMESGVNVFPCFGILFGVAIVINKSDAKLDTKSTKNGHKIGNEHKIGHRK